MLIYKNVIAQFLKENFGSVDVIGLHDDGTLYIKICGAYVRDIEEAVTSQFPRIKKVCVEDSKTGVRYLKEGFPA